MLTIGLLGSDNSHAERFSELLNCPDHPHYLAAADARIVAIWGEDAARTAQVAEQGKIARIVDEPTAMLGQVDAVICVTRHGGRHLDLVRPYLEAGVPTFVDKPLATEPADARAIVALAQKQNTPFTSYSTVRFSADTQTFLQTAQGLGGVRVGIYSGPATRRNPYGGVIFYAIHSIELMLMVQGTGIEWVQAVEGPPTDGAGNGNLTAICAWPDGATATLELTVDAQYGFHAMALGRAGSHAMRLEISDCYRAGMQRILPVLRGKMNGQLGDPAVPTAQMIEAVVVGKAIDLSLDRGQRVFLRDL
jgi:predicted dehydrogenase